MTALGWPCAPASPPPTGRAGGLGWPAGAVPRETSVGGAPAVPSSAPTSLAEDEDTPIAAEARRAVGVLNASGRSSFARPDRTRIITVANQKGGVGKTTTTVNLAVALALHGLHVLVVDLDPQGNASTALGLAHHRGVPSTYSVLLDDLPLADAATPVEAAATLTGVPATIDLAGAEIELVGEDRREFRLREAIENFLAGAVVPPDYVLIDCPPSLGLLTLNALVAAEEVLIPIQCEYYALEGLGQLVDTISKVTAHLNPRLSVSTILLTMYDARTRLADQVAEEVRTHFGDTVLHTVIPRSVRVSEAPSFGQSVITYDAGSRGAVAYVDAARELAARGVGMAAADPTPGPATSPVRGGSARTVTAMAGGDTQPEE